MSLIFWRIPPRALMWTGFVLATSVAVAWETTRLWPTSAGALQDAARVSGVLALVWSVCAAVAAHGPVGWIGVTDWTSKLACQVGPTSSFAVVAGVIALLLGAVTAAIQSVVLSTRAICVAVELVKGYPFNSAGDFGFGTEGLWSLGFLFAACAVAPAATRDRRLGTCQLWTAIMLASWWCLLSPALRPMPAGGFERTGHTLRLLVALSTLLASTVVITGWMQRKKRGRIRVTDWTSKLACQVGPTSPDVRVGSCRPWPGLPSSTAVIALGVIALVCVHLAVPISIGGGGFRVGSIVVTASASLSAFACFLLLLQTWHGGVADAAMGLTSLALCGLATVVVPSQPAALAGRYPMIFNAMMVGLAVATVLWTHLASIWRSQPGDVRPLDVGKTWQERSSATVGRLAPYAQRFAFFNASLALVVGVVMAVWPRWPGIAPTDDSLGRVSAGVAANLFLLLVMLWCARRSNKLTFKILTALTVVSAVGFVMVRMMPWSPRFG